MTYEVRDNSGTLFINDKKESDKHPDRSGSAMIDGVEYWVSGWIKKGAKGQFMSLAFKRKGQAQRPDPISSGRQSINDDMNDDIPFAPEFR